MLRDFSALRRSGNVLFLQGAFSKTGAAGPEVAEAYDLEPEQSFLVCRAIEKK